MKPDRSVSAALFIFSVAIALLSVALLPFFSLRANRTATGTGLILYAVSPGAALALGASLAASLAGFLLRGRKFFRLLGFAGLCLVVPLAFIAAAGASGTILETQPPQARVSFGIGFLVLLVSVYGALASCTPIFGAGSNRAMNSAFFAAAGSIALLAAAGAFDDLSIVREFANRRATFLAESVRHVAYASGATAAALLVALPLGYAASKSRFWEHPVFLVANAAQAVPTLSLLGLLIVPLSLLGSAVPALAAIGVRGVGWAPAFIVLFLYALLPIAANTQAGFRSIDGSALDAARGMGMTKREGFLLVELPLALPAIIAGVRTALTQNLGNAVLAGLIGGGGLGSLIFLGLAQAAPDLVLLGSLPVIGAVFAAERLMAALEKTALHRAGLQGVHA